MVARPVDLKRLTQGNICMYVYVYVYIYISSSYPLVLAPLGTKRFSLARLEEGILHECEIRTI